MIQLQSHPFPVVAHFDHSLVLTYALPATILQKMIPDCLTIDSWQEQWGFVAAAFVHTRGLRPAGFPRWMGNDFVLSGYRIFVRYKDKRGRRLRGLYIIRSVTNSRWMNFAGNFFTKYKYTAAPDLQMINKGSELQVISPEEHIQISAAIAAAPALPATSVFNNWQEARRFAGPLPFTFSVEQKKNRVVIIEGVRESWTPQPVAVQQADIGWLEQPPFLEKRLASAFLVSNIPYRWKKGVIEQIDTNTASTPV